MDLSFKKIFARYNARDGSKPFDLAVHILRKANRDFYIIVIYLQELNTEKPFRSMKTSFSIVKMHQKSNFHERNSLEGRY